MEKLKKSLTGLIVPVLSVLLAFIIGAIIMAGMGTNPVVAFSALFKGEKGAIFKDMGMSHKSRSEKQMVLRKNLEPGIQIVPFLHFSPVFIAVLFLLIITSTLL